MQEDEQAIRALITAWMQATRDGDVEAILSLVAEDARFLLPGHEPLSKDDFAETQRVVANMAFDIDYEIREIAVSGDLAYCWNHISVEIAMPGRGKPLRRAGNVLSVFRREAGRWLLARDVNQLVEI